MLRKKVDLYFTGLAIMAIGLPVSEFLMSISVMTIAVAWLIDGPKKIQWKAFVRNKLAWSAVFLFLIPFISLLWTDNYAYGFHDLKIKLPLLLVPFLIAPYAITEKKFYILLALLVGSTFVGSIIVYLNYIINLDESITNIRDKSIFISHIRFSLIIDICIFILFYAAIKWRNYYSILAVAMGIWLIYFIFFLGSGNGFIGLVVISVFGLSYLLYNSQYRKVAYALTLLFIVFFAYVFYLVQISYKSHFVVKADSYNEYKPILKKNAGYYSLKDDFQLENGFYVYRNISNSELNSEWRKMSGPKFYEFDSKGQAINGTIIRYLSSRSLSKDSIGINQLSEEDVIHIQNGEFHFEQHEWNNLHLRIDQLFYQLMAYYYHGDPGNKPLLQRFFYWKGALTIIKADPIYGVGTGDIQDAFNEYFKNELSELGREYWWHTHNQYMTYFVIAGVFGFLIFIMSVFYPLSIYIKRNLILTLVQIVLLVSFLSEDTLETQSGVTMYILFIALAIALFNHEERAIIKS